MPMDAIWDEELEAGYIYLPDHPGAGTPGCVARSIDVFALDESLRGMQIILHSIFCIRSNIFNHSKSPASSNFSMYFDKGLQCFLTYFP